MKSMNFADRRVASEAFDPLYPYSIQPIAGGWAVYNLHKEGLSAPYGKFQDYKGALKLAQALSGGRISMRPSVPNDADNITVVNGGAVNLGPMGNKLA